MGGVELLSAGRERPRRAPGRSRWLGLVVVAAAVVGVAQVDREVPAAPVAGSGPPPVAVTDLGHPVLYGAARWELFGRGADEVVRVELARGRVTRTAVPVLPGGAPVSFVVTADRAVVRSAAAAPGYVVPDGQPARPVPPALGAGGALVPDPGVARGVPAPDGRLAAPGTDRGVPAPDGRLAAPGTGRGVPAPDGRPAAPGAGRGVLAPDGRLAAVLAAGPYLLDLASGARRPIARPAGEDTAVWSPDSRWLFLAGSDGAIRAVDPATAAVTLLGISLTPPVQLAVRPAPRR